jgi:hypothetical protein
MARLAVTLAIATTLAACGGGPVAERSGDASGLDASPVSVAVLPASALPRMTSDSASVDADQLASEVTHPDELRSILAQAGFASGAERSFGGGTGAFSRVLARGLAFETGAGAAAFVTWFGDNAPEEIITSERISPAGVPDGAVVFRHEPSGCCHNDVPVFLAAWQRGSSVLYLHVGGRKANTRAFVQLIESYDREV